MLTEENTAPTEAVEAVVAGDKVDGEAPIKQEDEAKVVEPVAKPDPVHNKLAALSRRENAIWKREKELKSLEAELKTRQEKETATKEEYKKNPMKLLEDHGLTYERMIDAAIGAPQKNEAPEVVELRSKLEAIEKREQSRQQQLEIEQKKQQANAYAQDLKGYLESVEGKFDLIKETNNYQLVLDTIIEKYQTDGEEVSWDVAADWVEEYLEGEYKTNLTKLLSVSKIRKLLELDAVTTEETVEPTDSKTETTEDVKDLEDAELAQIISRKKDELKQRFTLTNKEMSSTSKVTDGKLTREERLERAKALEQTL
jgi:hypothetical protein